MDDSVLKCYNNFSFSNGMDKNDIADVLEEFEDYFMPKKMLPINNKGPKFLGLRVQW